MWTKTIFLNHIYLLLLCTGILPFCMELEDLLNSQKKTNSVDQMTYGWVENTINFLLRCLLLNYVLKSLKCFWILDGKLKRLHNHNVFNLSTVVCKDRKRWHIYLNEFEPWVVHIVSPVWQQVIPWRLLWQRKFIPP